MKKPVIVLISLLAIFCVIYNFSNVTAAEDNDTTTIVDFEDNTEESKGGTKENESIGTIGSLVLSDEAPSETSNTEATTEVASEEETEELDESQEEDSSDKAKSTSSTNPFSKSKDEALDSLISNSEPDVMGEGYEFGDDILPKTDSEGFFHHVYSKIIETFSGIQIILIAILSILFIISAFLAAAMTLGKKSREQSVPFLIACLIDAIAIVVIGYAPQLLASFQDWFVTY